MNQWHNEMMSSTLILDGEWEFSLDGQSGSIRTPGVWEAQGYAHRVDGPAFFRRTLAIPADWQGKQVQIQFDALSYHVEVQINGIWIGEHTGLWTAFAFDVTDAIRSGEGNTIELVVYKPGERFPMRESLAGFLPDVCIPFGGIWQQARLVAFTDAALSDLWLLPDAESGSVQVEASLHHAQDMIAVVRLLDPDGRESAIWYGTVESGYVRTTLTINNPRKWSPQTPTLYTVEIRLESERENRLLVRRKFGFRKLSSEGERLLFNGESVFLRGILNWGWYPEILCPAPDEATIRDEFRRVRSLGYNFIKLCLYVPSPRYFEIADEEGMLLWLELPMWLPQVTERLSQQAPIEYSDILAQVHTHPSVVIYSLGCELDAAVNAELLSRLNGLLRSRTSGVLACDNSGSGEAYGGLAFDYADFNDYHFYCDLHYFEPLVDHFWRDWRPARPWIFGEFCDADDYRDLEEIAAAYGGVLPWWLTEQNPVHALTAIAFSKQTERMAQLSDLGFSGQDIQRISRQQSFIVRKTILEKVRARASMSGYVVTGIRDTPLATSSMFDDQGRSKYDSDAFRAFNADTVLILEQGRKRVWKRGGDRPSPVDPFNLTANSLVDYRIVIAHAGQPLRGGKLRWQVLDANGIVLKEGTATVEGPLLGGAPREIAAIGFVAPETSGAYTLSVDFGTVHNQWALWVYPALNWSGQLAWYDPSGNLDGLESLRKNARIISRSADFESLTDYILLTNAADETVIDFVRKGGRAVILQSGQGFLPTVPRPFWREAIKLFYDHPVWADFPHRGYTDLQFYHLAADYVLNTTELKAALPDLKMAFPILRRLDARQFTIRDYMIELRIGTGVAIASTLRFAGEAGDQVCGLEANVAGRHLLLHMLNYLAAGSFSSNN